MAEKKIDYKRLSSELDEVLGKLQSADLDVDEAVKAYERGMEIAKELEAYLKEAENKVTKIKADWEARSK
jgi:exodeoxyribonuclease VII small subunit